MAKNRGGKGKRIFKSPLSKTQFTDWCDETTSYQLKVDLVSYNNKKYLLRQGAGSLGFISIHKNSFTIVHIYRRIDLKKEYISTRRFSGKLAWKRVREIIFKDSISVASAKKRSDLCFRTIHKQTIIPIKEFKENFKPNQQMKKSYSSTAKDTALTSLSDILKELEKTTLVSGTYSAGFNNVMKAINFCNNSYNGSRPAVSIYAIWANFDPESKLVNTGEFDIGEPVFYEYKIIKEKK